MTQEGIHKFIEEITTELDSVHAAILAKHPHDEAGVPVIENQDLANAVGAIERACAIENVLALTPEIYWRQRGM